MLRLEFSTSMYKSFQIKKNECKSETSWREICMIILMLWQDTNTQKFESECYFLYLQGLLNVSYDVAKYHPVLLADPTDKNLRVQCQAHFVYVFSVGWVWRLKWNKPFHQTKQCLALTLVFFRITPGFFKR